MCGLPESAPQRTICSRRSDENDEFLIGNIQIEILHRYDTFVGNEKIRSVAFRFVGSFLFLCVLFLLVAGKRVDFLDVLQGYTCHSSEL